MHNLGSDRIIPVRDRGHTRSRPHGSRPHL